MNKHTHINRREFLTNTTAAGIATTTLGITTTAATATEPKQPNILFIFTDQQSARAMSACGNPWLKTPHMDSIAAKGTMFTESYCTSPVCGPSRSSIMTGRYPHETGVNHNGKEIKASIPNMGQVFEAADYTTAYAGKWHLSASYPTTKSSIPGFEYLLPKRPKGYLTGSKIDSHATDAAIEFLQRKHAKPFLLTLSLHNPHDICQTRKPTAQMRKQMTPENLPPLPDNFAILADEPEFIQICRKRDHYGDQVRKTLNWTTKDWREYLFTYYRFCEEIDIEVGRVLSELRKQGLEEDTLIVFTSDHGEGMAAHQWIVKLMFWEEPVTVPMVVSWKGKTNPGVIDHNHLVSGLDILPTLCDYANIPCPKTQHGISMRSVIEKPNQQGQSFVVSELAPDNEKKGMMGRMVRTSKYKYVIFSEGKNPEMLFDLKADPGETQNLAGDTGMKKELTRHCNLLKQWIKETDDSFPLSTLERS